MRLQIDTGLLFSLNGPEIVADEEAIETCGKDTALVFLRGGPEIVADEEAIETMRKSRFIVSSRYALR